MSFLATIWLAALAALALPVVLHLVSRGHKRRVRIGSVRLLRSDASFRARRLRPSQLLLMLVRCALLAALALALAEPRWWRELGGGDGRGWILASPSVLAAPADDATARLDALVAEGHALRLLAPGFPQADRDADGPRPTGVPDAWSLLREADALAPPGAPLFVFTEDRLATLRGRRPTLARRVEWMVAGAGVELQPAEPPVDAAAPEPAVAVVRFAPERAEDAGYVRAALEAAAEHAGVPLRLDAADETDLGEDAGLFVWLSAEPVPEEALARGGIVLSDGLGRHESRACRAVLAEREIELRRSSDAEEVDGEAVLWRDGLGRPLLTASRLREGTWYRFHGRFHPLWSDLVFAPAFPEWLLGLLDAASPPAATAAAEDLRGTSSGQRLPRFAESLTVPARRSSRAVELAFWGAVALLFGVERWLAIGGRP